MAVSELRSRCRGFWRRRLLHLRDRIDRRVARLEARIAELAAKREAAAVAVERPRSRRRPVRRPRRGRPQLET